MWEAEPFSGQNPLKGKTLSWLFLSQEGGAGAPPPRQVSGSTELQEYLPLPHTGRCLRPRQLQGARGLVLNPGERGREIGGFWDRG